MSQRLGVARLFSDPPLFRTLPTGLQFAADGSFCAFLRTAEDDRERFDVWRYDLGDQPPRCWVDARSLRADRGELSEAEKAERERRRQFGAGITSFALSPDGEHLLLCADGAGYLLDVDGHTPIRVTPADTRQTALGFSSNGSQLSYVRDGNLYRYAIATAQEHPVTEDGGGLLTYGLPDFIAAEEMHRHAGHWWSPDDTLLAFTRVNEGAVAVSRRFEIGAEDFEVIEQRYPYAGAKNAEVDLLVHDLGARTTSSIPYRLRPDDYLARVAWSGDRLAVQTQSRDQQTLSLLLVDPRTGERETLLEERSATWTELHDNFRAVDAERFVWTSERSGSMQLYLYHRNTGRALTSEPGRVNKVLHADGKQVFFLGWRQAPTEQHLFRVSLEQEAGDGPAQQLTSQPGWHDVVMAPDAGCYLDQCSSLTHPSEIALARLPEPARAFLSDPVDSNHPYFPYRENHVTPTLGTLSAEDGQTLHYRLTRPAPTGERQPVIVSVYGGPGVQRVRNEWPPLTLQLFSQLGFGVLELDNRGSSNRERRFQDPIYGQLGAVEVADQVRGVEFLRSMDWVDPDRIGVFGHSYGGYMALMCMTKAPQAFKAGVAVAPVSDWRLYDTHYTERYLRTPAENPEGYLASSVFPYLGQLRGRVLIMHGMADDNVLFTHSTKLFAALQHANKRFDMMTYPGSKHALQEREVSIHRFELILEFFRREL